MGGSALLINGGKEVSGEDLFEIERFDQGKATGTKDGLDAQQMEQTYHALVGIRDGQAYLIVPNDKSGRQIQEDLGKEGEKFGTVLKLDGRSGCFLKDTHQGRPRSLYSGRNIIGMGIHIRKSNGTSE